MIDQTFAFEFCGERFLSEWSRWQQRSSLDKSGVEELMPGRQPWEKELRSVRHAKVRDVFKKKYLGRCFVDDFSERKVVLVDWAACTEMNNGIAQWVLVSELLGL